MTSCIAADASLSPVRPAWRAVYALALGVFGLIVAEFLPASLLTPMASSLGVSEGMAGQAVTATALVALVTGLLIATATGLGAFALGYPFLTTHTAHVHLPLVGDFHVASALFYDIGVFALVVGATLLILTALGHQAVRGHRRPRSMPAPTGTPVAPPIAADGAQGEH